MYNHHAFHGYRPLTTEEQAIAEQAIVWLANKRLRPYDIARLTDQNLDRESKLLCVAIEKGRLIFNRRINYAGTIFDQYLTEVLPYLKVKKWLFPNRGWTGGNASFGFHVHLEDVENFLQNRAKKLLHFGRKFVTIKASTKKSYIQKQIQVGRRIALRA